MLYAQYLNKSVNIVISIYNIIFPFTASHQHPRKNQSEFELNNLFIRFEKIKNEYLSLTNTTIDKNIIYESKWNTFIEVKCINNNYFNIDLEFFIDYPILNMYGLIIHEQGFETHYKFKLDQLKNNYISLDLSDEIQIIIDDNIVDAIRKGELRKKGKIYSALTNDKILNIPINYTNINLENSDWSNEIISCLENELLRLSDKSIKKVLNKKVGIDNTFLFYS